MLTGDEQNSADAVAQRTGITNLNSAVVPEEKSKIIKKYQQKGCRVGMIGDGINDAPALAQAEVGISMGSGTDVALETSDVVLMNNDLRHVVVALLLSRATLRNIRQNLFWAFGYNVIGIPVAAGLLVPLGGPALHPMLAATAMVFSSVSVRICFEMFVDFSAWFVIRSFLISFMISLIEVATSISLISLFKISIGVLLTTK